MFNQLLKPHVRWARIQTFSVVCYFRQIRDMVNCIFCEQMLICYINIFRDTFWPNGKLAPHVKVRTDSERSETKERAQQKLLDNIPGRTTGMTCRSSGGLDHPNSLLYLSVRFFQMHSQIWSASRMSAMESSRSSMRCKRPMPTNIFFMWEQ